MKSLLKLTGLVAFLVAVNVAQAIAQVDPTCFKCCGTGLEPLSIPGHRSCFYGEYGCHVTDCAEPQGRVPGCCDYDYDTNNDLCATNPYSDGWTCAHYYLHWCN